MPPDKTRRGKQMRPDQLAVPPAIAQERALKKVMSARIDAAHFDLCTNLNSVLTVEAVKLVTVESIDPGTVEIDHENIAKLSVNSVDAIFKQMGIREVSHEDEDNKPKIEV